MQENGPKNGQSSGLGVELEIWHGNQCMGSPKLMCVDIGLLPWLGDLVLRLHHAPKGTDARIIIRYKDKVS